MSNVKLSSIYTDGYVWGVCYETGHRTEDGKTEYEIYSTFSSKRDAMARLTELGDELLRPFLVGLKPETFEQPSVTQVRNKLGAEQVELPENVIAACRLDMPGLEVGYVSASGKLYRAVITDVPWEGQPTMQVEWIAPDLQVPKPWQPIVSLEFRDERGKLVRKKRVMHRNDCEIELKCWDYFKDE